MQCRNAGGLCRREQGGCSHRSLPSDLGLCRAAGASTECRGGLCSPSHSGGTVGCSFFDSVWFRHWTLMSRQCWCCWNSRFCSKIKVHNFFCCTKEAVAIPCETCGRNGGESTLAKQKGIKYGGITETFCHALRKAINKKWKPPNLKKLAGEEARRREGMPWHPFISEVSSPRSKVCS